jgi:N-acetylglutamate synthase-like GNAT family acetyltransferase
MPIRKANLNDLDAINILLDQLGGYHNTQSFLSVKLPTLLSDATQYIFVYEQDDDVIGLASAQIILELGLEKDTMLITYLVVNDQYRSLGVGRKLEQHCCDLAISNNCGRIQLHCSKRRTRAHDFYQSLGYAESPKYFSKQLQ